LIVSIISKYRIRLISPVITDLMCRLSSTYQIDKMEEP